MMYAVFFEDDENHADKRQKHMHAHLAFLEQNAATIHAAGPLKDAQVNSPAGGLWIVETDNPQTVQALIEADPFWPTGLRKSVRILEWIQVFSNGKTSIQAS